MSLTQCIHIETHTEFGLVFGGFWFYFGSEWFRFDFDFGLLVLICPSHNLANHTNVHPSAWKLKTLNPLTIAKIVTHTHNAQNLIFSYFILPFYTRLIPLSNRISILKYSGSVSLPHLCLVAFYCSTKSLGKLVMSLNHTIFTWDIIYFWFGANSTHISNCVG